MDWNQHSLKSGQTGDSPIGMGSITSPMNCCPRLTLSIAPSAKSPPAFVLPYHRRRCTRRCKKVRCKWESHQVVYTGSESNASWTLIDGSNNTTMKVNRYGRYIMEAWGAGTSVLFLDQPQWQPAGQQDGALMTKKRWPTTSPKHCRHGYKFRKCASDYDLVSISVAYADMIPAHHAGTRWANGCAENVAYSGAAVDQGRMQNAGSSPCAAASAESMVVVGRFLGRGRIRVKGSEFRYDAIIIAGTW